MDHKHSLQLKAPGAPYKCSGCKELGFGSSYCCDKNNCSYILHQECANPEKDSRAFHPFLEKSYFEFYKKAPGDKARYCDACGNDILGYVYHCSRTGFDLHPCCLKLKLRISDGNLTLKLSEKVPSKCAKCKHKNVVGQVRGWSYVSGNSCYHVSCFKDLIFENWRRGYFNCMSTGNGESDELALTSMEMVQSSRRSRRTSTITKIVVMVFKLVFSAIFGNPISAIAALLEALATD